MIAKAGPADPAGSPLDLLVANRRCWPGRTTGAGRPDAFLSTV
jgi:hypothetical protein